MTRPWQRMRSGFARFFSNRSPIWHRPRPSPSPYPLERLTRARALPLSTVLALVACLFVAVSIGELAKHLPSAGGFYTYTSKALHPWVGFLVAWAYAGAEALIASFLFLNFSFVLADALNSSFGWTKDTWWVWVLATALIVLALGYFGVRVSTHAGTIMGAFEIIVFGLIAIWLIAKAGHANSFSVFTTHNANVKGYAGMSGIIAGWGLLGAGVHRIRVSGTARRGGPRPQANHPQGRHPLVPVHRTLLRVHNLCCHRLAYLGQHGQLRLSETATHGPSWPRLSGEWDGS